VPYGGTAEENAVGGGSGQPMRRGNGNGNGNGNGGQGPLINERTMPLTKIEVR
jgi:hypothetical protein